MTISGLFTEVRHRFQTQDSLTQWSYTQHLLSGVHKHQKGPDSLASSASDISSSMRECVDSGMRLYKGANIQPMLNLKNRTI